MWLVHERTSLRQHAKEGKKKKKKASPEQRSIAEKGDRGGGTLIPDPVANRIYKDVRRGGEGGRGERHFLKTCYRRGESIHNFPFVGQAGGWGGGGKKKHFLREVQKKRGDSLNKLPVD